MTETINQLSSAQAEKERLKAELDKKCLALDEQESVMKEFMKIVSPDSVIDITNKQSVKELMEKLKEQQQIIVQNLKVPAGPNINAAKDLNEPDHPDFMGI